MEICKAPTLRLKALNKHTHIMYIEMKMLSKTKTKSVSFHCCLTFVLWPEEADFPENLLRVVCVIINKHSFESVVCVWILFPLFLACQVREFCDTQAMNNKLFETARNRERSRLCTVVAD